MTCFKKILCLLLAAFLLTALVPPAFAADGDERFEGKTWDEIIQDFFEEHSTETKRIALGYYNTVTGEEHYYQGDMYMTAASLYKVPLNMYYTDKIHEGEMDWDTAFGGLSYSDILLWTIRDSNNDIAEMMQRYIGNYLQYREALLPYIGETLDSVDSEYFRLNTFNAQQMVFALRQVWEDQDRFAGIIDAMLLASPDNYFKYAPIEYDVAHKYGYLEDDWHLYMHDMGYVFTDQPIIIVFMADTISYHLQAMTDYCALMADYAQYTAAHTPAPAEEPDAPAAEDPEDSAAPSSDSHAGMEEDIQSAPVREPAPAPASQPAPASAAEHTRLLILIAAVSFACAVAAFLFRSKIKLLWSLCAVLCTGMALSVCVLAPKVGMVICRPVGDPASAVESFFSAMIDGNYAAAYSCLSDHRSLGLENIPEKETDALVYGALRDSYAYELIGDCVQDGLSAVQRVSFRCFALTDISHEVEEKTAQNIEQFVSTHLKQDIYDENDNYLPSVVTEAYHDAIGSVLDHAEDYYRTVEFDVTLNYVNGSWRIVTDSALLEAILGGIV